MWEYVNGRRIEYPKPRYSDQIIMRPENAEWQPLAGTPGVLTKSLGDFTERHVSVTMIRVQPGGVATIGPRAGTQVGMVLSGAGTVDGKQAGVNTFVKIGTGAIASVETGVGLEIVIFGLPIFGAAHSIAA
jgi:hypothetical protein